MLEVLLLMLSSMAQAGAAVSAPPAQAEVQAQVQEEPAAPQDAQTGAEAEPLPESVIEARPPSMEILPAPQPAPEAAPEDTAEAEAAPQVAILAPREGATGSQDTVAPPAFLAPKPAAPSGGLVAEPQVATGRFLTALEVRPILNATQANWIAVREYGGQDLLYVTHLWSWRCGLLELRIGLNGATPEIWPLPPCHEDLPAAAAILESDGLPYRSFPLRSVQLIEVQLTYDDLGTSKVRFNRAGGVIP